MFIKLMAMIAFYAFWKLWLKEAIKKLLRALDKREILFVIVCLSIIGALFFAGILVTVINSNGVTEAKKEEVIPFLGWTSAGCVFACIATTFARDWANSTCKS